MTEKRCICLQLEEYIADNMIELCEKRGISKYRLAQMTGIAQSSLGRIMAKESLPSLPTLEKICEALDVTLSQFFCEGDPDDLTQPQSEVLAIWNDLSVQEQEKECSFLIESCSVVCKSDRNSSIVYKVDCFFFITFYSKEVAGDRY